MVAVSEVVPLADDEGRSVADACVADEAEEEEGAAEEDVATWTWTGAAVEVSGGGGVYVDVGAGGVYVEVGGGVYSGVGDGL